MFQVISGTPKATPDYNALHLNALLRAVENYDENDRTCLYKMVYHGVKIANTLVGDTDFENAETRLTFAEIIGEYISQLTPNELMQIFPLSKEYDGNRWGCKDYFSTISSLEKHGLDSVIGESCGRILWGYMNNDITDYMVDRLCAASELRKMETGTGIMEEFCEENGITTYTMTTDAITGKRYITNNDTGLTREARKPKPRYLKLAGKE